MNRTQSQSFFIFSGFFVFWFFFFLFFQASATFADPDAFYHLKFALLMAFDGLVQDFVWLPLTNLANAFSDQHFLYHVILIPFVTFSPSPFIGMKIATALFAAMFCVSMAWFLKRSGLSAIIACLLVLLAVFTNPLTYRLSLAKAQGLVLFWFFIGMGLVAMRRPLAVFCWAFLFGWLYGGFPIFLFTVFIFLFFDFIFSRTAPHSFRFRLKHCKTIELGLASLLGALASMTLHPYFPSSIPFFWDQFFEIGVRNYQNIIGVGGEWYPYGPGDFVNNTIVLSSLFLVACYLMAAHWEKKDSLLITFFVCSIAFIAFTLKSRRMVEWAVPFMATFIGLSLRPVARHFSWSRLLAWFWMKLSHSSILSIFLTIYFITLFPAIMIRDGWINREQLKNGIPVSATAQAAVWMSENIPPGELIVHSDWDEFPLLFYYDDRHQYVAGLDPTFFYLKDPARYWVWVDLTTGKIKENISAILQSSFQSTTLFATKDHEELISNLENDPLMKKVFEDDEAVIYRAQNSE